MTISFNGISPSLRVPFVFVEFDNSKAQQGPSIQEYKTLMIGQKLSTGSATALSLYTVTQESQARSLFGAGSMLHHMCARYLQNNKVVPLKVMPLADNGAGVAATGTFTVSGTATAAGVLNCYIGGRKVVASIVSGDTASGAATKLAAAINADTDSHVTAVAVSAVVTVTYKHKGTVGNQLDLRMNYNDGESSAAGLSVVVVAMASGVTDPAVSTVISALDETQYNVWVAPYTDSANLTSIETELADRWGPIRQNDGVYISSKADLYANLETLGNARNSAHVSLIRAAGPSTSWEFAAATAAVVALSAQIDPARPFQTLELAGILSPNSTETLTLMESDLLLHEGISTHLVDDGGVVRIQRLITTFKTNAFGATDVSYLDVNTPLTLSYLRFDFKATMSSKYPRHKLANDGTRFGPGQAVITPKIGKAEALGKFRQWEELGLVENFDQFKRDLIVERNAQNVNRLDFLLPTDLINQLVGIGAQIQFLL